MRNRPVGMRKWLNIRLSLAAQFLLASLAVLVISMLGLGWWITNQIEQGVINRTAAETALYVDSFIDPPLQELNSGSALTPKYADMLNQLMIETPLGQHVVAFKLWDSHGRILYSTNPALTGQVFPLKDELLSSIEGKVVSHLTDLKDDENFLERGRWKRLLETYSPVNKSGTSQVIAVVEFYQTVDTLEAEISKAKSSTWLLLGGSTLIIYLSLSIFVRRASSTIEHQQARLTTQVTSLKELLAQNKELDERVRRAASRTTTLNERFLRRISAELHDGPVQDLGYSLMRLDTVIATVEKQPQQSTNGHVSKEELSNIETALQNAMAEIRTISSGLGLPELDQLSLKKL